MPSTSTLGVLPVANVASHTPWWLWPNILSLDAPLVAALWQHLAAKDAGVHLSPASTLALPLSVWVIYLADRLMDSLGSESPGAPARHLFYKRYRLIGVCLLLLASAILADTLRFLPAEVLRSGLLVGVLVAAYLLIVHVLPQSIRRFLPKELAVALIFAAGTTLSVWSDMQNPFTIVLPVLLFALLCWLNCSAIDVWEGGRSQWMVARLTPVSVALCFVSLAVLPFTSCHLLLFAVAVCSLAYSWLACVRTSFATAAVRVLADLPLMIPLLLLGWR